VIDGVPNMKHDEVTQRAELFVITLRKARPGTPIELPRVRAIWPDGSCLSSGRCSSRATGLCVMPRSVSLLRGFQAYGTFLASRYVAPTAKILSMDSTRATWDFSDWLTPLSRC
jgi:hypothetical protein